LIIRNFGPIKDVQLELGRFNILIGKQATGKSTVAKILSICRYFSYIVQKNEYEQSFARGLISWGMGEFLQNDTYISYQCQHYLLQVTRAIDTDNEVSNYGLPPINLFLQPKSTVFKGLLTELDKIRPTAYDILNSNDIGEWTIPASFFQNDVSRVMDNPFYLPAERGLQSVFSLGKGGVQNISDSLFLQLSNLDRIARAYKRDIVIEPLDITYRNEDGHGFVRKNNELAFYSMYNAATGFQSTIPVVLAVKHYTESRNKKKTFIIEEPEENLFPDAQNKLIEFLVDGVANFGHSILLTTHSPYVLTSVNNLMYAYKIGQMDALEVGKIVDKKYWIDPLEVSAYMLQPNGSCEDIFDASESLIKADKIDEISGIINDKFNTLLNIEYSKK